jgi:hypothetical protein
MIPLMPKLDTALAKFDAVEAKSFHDDYRNLFEEAMQILPCYDREFLAFMEKQEFCQSIFNIIIPMGKPEEQLANFDQILATLPEKNTDLPLSSFEYRKFVEKLAHFDIRRFMQGESPIDIRPAFYGFVNSLFLERYLKPDQTLKIRQLPEILRHEFGFGFSKGNLDIDILNEYAFPAMRGGRVHIGETIGHVGHRMSGGFLDIDLSRDSVGSSATGGTVTVKRSLGDINDNYMAKNMTLYIENLDGVFDEKGIDKGTIFIESAASDFRCNNGVVLNRQYRQPLNTKDVHGIDLVLREQYDGFKYDDRDDEFVGTDYLRMGQKTIFTAKVRGEEVEFYGHSPHLTIFKDRLPKIWEMSRGFALIKKVGEVDNIGEGMSGGMIIIDDHSMTLEEARKRVSKNRTGGLVFYLQHDGKKSFFNMRQRGAKFVNIS